MKFFVKRGYDRELIEDEGCFVEAMDADSAVKIWSERTNHTGDQLKKEGNIWRYWGVTVSVVLTDTNSFDLEVIEAAKVFVEHVRHPTARCSDQFTRLVEALANREKAGVK